MLTISTEEQKAAEAADTVRREHGYGFAPIANIGELIESVNPSALIAITEMPDGLDGMVLKDPVRNRVVVGIATTSIPERQRFSLAHELGHIIFEDYGAGDPSDCSARTPAEIRADHFARHLLAPLDGVEALLSETGAPPREVNLRDLAQIVRHFGVSPIVARIQLERLRLLTPELSGKWSRYTGESLAAAFGHLNEYRATAAQSQVPVPPQHLVERATRAYTVNVLGIGALARLAEVEKDELEAALRDAGRVPEPVKPLEVSDEEFLGL